jgi:hypothetical protein
VPLARCLIPWVLLSAGVVSATVVYRGYERASIELFQRVVLEGERTVQKRGGDVRFFPSGERDGATMIMEVDDMELGFTGWIVREGIYLGEFLVRRNSAEHGGFEHHHTVDLLAESIPRRTGEPGYQRLNYLETETDFIWAGGTIVSLEGRARRCTYSEDGTLQAETQWEPFKTIERRLPVRILDRRTEPDLSNVWVSTYESVTGLERLLYTENELDRGMSWTGRMSARTGEAPALLRFLEARPRVRVVVEDGILASEDAEPLRVLKEVELTLSELGDADHLTIEITDADMAGVGSE